MPNPTLNSVVLCGRATRDPEIRYTKGGSPVCSFNFATNNRVKRGDEWQDDPMFIEIVLFGNQAEFVSQHMKKGTPVLIYGRLEFDQWESQDGQKRSRHKVVANTVQLLEYAKEESSHTSPPPLYDENDDIPF